MDKIAYLLRHAIEDEQNGLSGSGMTKKVVLGVFVNYFLLPLLSTDFNFFLDRCEQGKQCCKRLQNRKSHRNRARGQNVEKSAGSRRITRSLKLFKFIGN